MSTRIAHLDLLLVGAVVSVAVLTAACLMLYVGLGVIYGSYVGLSAHAVDVKFVSAKMARLRMMAGTLQMPLAALIWFLHARRGGSVSIATRVWRILYTLVFAQVVALGITFVLANSALRLLRSLSGGWTLLSRLASDDCWSEKVADEISRFR